MVTFDDAIHLAKEVVRSCADEQTVKLAESFLQEVGHEVPQRSSDTVNKRKLR